VQSLNILKNQMFEIQSSWYLSKVVIQWTHDSYFICH